jgi:hypothetical protein
VAADGVAGLLGRGWRRGRQRIPPGDYLCDASSVHQGRFGG